MSKKKDEVRDETEDIDFDYLDSRWTSIKWIGVSIHSLAHLYRNSYDRMAFADSLSFIHQDA